MAFVSTDLSQPGPYRHQEFPKMVYRGVEYRVVADDAAWQALGPGWGHPSELVPIAVEVVASVSGEFVEAPAEKPRGRKSKG